MFLSSGDEHICIWQVYIVLLNHLWSTITITITALITRSPLNYLVAFDGNKILYFDQTDSLVTNNKDNYDSELWKDHIYAWFIFIKRRFPSYFSWTKNEF